MYKSSVSMSLPIFSSLLSLLKKSQPNHISFLHWYTCSEFHLAAHNSRECYSWGGGGESLLKQDFPRQCKWCHQLWISSSLTFTGTSTLPPPLHHQFLRLSSIHKHICSPLPQRQRKTPRNNNNWSPLTLSFSYLLFRTRYLLSWNTPLLGSVPSSFLAFLFL